MLKKILLPLAAFTALATACPKGPAGAVTKDDIPDLSDLTAGDGDSTSAGAVGQPATLLQAASDQANQVRGDIHNILGFLDQATARDPDLAGQDDEGQDFGIWNISDDQTGNKVHVIAVKKAEDRVRILVTAENADGLSLPLLTGVFVKKAPHVGGGRFHLSFTNFSDLFGTEAAPGADGSLHVLFANLRPDLHGGRVLYLNVDDRATAEADPKSFAADLVNLVGVGGRFRSIYATDMVPQLEGLEAIGMRTAWLAGIGGRSDAVIVSQANGGQVLGAAHECWDLSGMRTAYQDSFADNDEQDPNDGDTTNCFDLGDDTIDQGQVHDGSDDADPELDDALDEAGANDVSEDEADDATDPSGSAVEDDTGDPAAP